MKKILSAVVIVIVVIVIWQVYPTEKKRLKGDILTLKDAVEKETQKE